MSSVTYLVHDQIHANTGKQVLTRFPVIRQYIAGRVQDLMDAKMQYIGTFQSVRNYLMGCTCYIPRVDSDTLKIVQRWAMMDLSNLQLG